MENKQLQSMLIPKNYFLCTQAYSSEKALCTRLRPSFPVLSVGLHATCAVLVKSKQRFAKIGLYLSKNLLITPSY